MNKTHMIALAAGVAVGWFAGATLASYQPWRFVKEKAENLAA